jgi:integrase
VLSERDLLARAQRRPDCTPAPPKGRVTDPGYHRGRTPANKGLKFPPEPLTEDEILRLLKACPPTSPCRRRDHALIVLLWRSGLRIHEALLLEPRDLDPTVGMVHVRRGKGGKAGYSAMDAWAFERVGEWLEFRARYPRGPVFCICEGPTKGVRAVGAPSFRMRLKDLAREAGVAKRVHPHGFRHTLACDLMRSGDFPLSFIQHQLRHSNPATTANYLVGLGADHSLAAVAARPAPSFAGGEQQGPVLSAQIEIARDRGASRLHRDRDPSLRDQPEREGSK